MAVLLEYPLADFPALLRECRARALNGDPDVRNGLERFAASVQGLSEGQLQELYADTFDFSESCTLDIGWHLFGDRHERGMFLSELRPRLAAAGIDERLELPDHLPHVLMLLSRSDLSKASELRSIVQRAVETLIANLHERKSPYEHLVASAFAAATRGA
jgi:nitrate reductase molybdenum cofactor assembly chaperone